MSVSRSEQSRINGAKSHGPKTPGGKAHSSMNALKHGRYAINAIVLSNEDAEVFEELVAHYVRRIQPADTVEYHLTRELASIDWCLTRNFAMATRLLDHEMEIQAPAFDSAGVAVSELNRVSTAGRAIVDRSGYPSFLARREGQLLRARHSILAVLKDLRKSFPLSDSSTEIVPPQPLNPDLPLPNEPGTNPESGPECDGADSATCISTVSKEAIVDLQIGSVPASSIPRSAEPKELASAPANAVPLGSASNPDASDPESHRVELSIASGQADLDRAKRSAATPIGPVPYVASPARGAGIGQGIVDKNKAPAPKSSALSSTPGAVTSNPLAGNLRPNLPKAA